MSTREPGGPITRRIRERGGARDPDGPLTRRIRREPRARYGTREEARRVAGGLLRMYDWRLDDVERVGNCWEVSAQGARVSGGEVGLSFQMAGDGKVRQVTLFGQDREHNEVDERRLTRLVRPRDAARLLGL